MPTLNEILTREIGKSGKSKTYIASQLGVSEKTIENYMKGNRHPKPAVMVKLSELLGFNLSELSEQNVPNNPGKSNPKDPKKDLLPRGERIITMDDYIALLERQNERMATIIEANLNVIQANLTGIRSDVARNQQMLRGISNRSYAYEETILKVLARQNKQPDDTYVEEADTRNIVLEGQSEQIDSNAAAHT